MNEREKAIVTAYTGISMLQGEGLNAFYKYLYELFGRPVYTHELIILADEIKKRSRNDFVALCGKTEPEPRWIPVSEKLPNFAQRVLVSIENFVYEAIYFDEDAGWSTYNVTFKDVDESEILAWMPLPEPYKEEQDGVH